VTLNSEPPRTVLEFVEERARTRSARTARSNQLFRTGAYQIPRYEGAPPRKSGPEDACSCRDERWARTSRPPLSRPFAGPFLSCS
jgi:hypothetical protein